MAYPTGLLNFTLEDIDRRASALLRFVQQLQAECAATNVPSSRILDAYIRLVQERAELVTAAAKPGIREYAVTAKNSPGLDVVVEFNAMIAAIDGITGWITANYPTDAGGYLLAKRFSGGTIIDRTFTPAETATFRTQLAALISTIN
jgi:hypothetical protein